MTEISLKEFGDILPVGVWFTAKFRDAPNPTSGRCKLLRWASRDIAVERFDSAGNGYESYISLSQLHVFDEGRGVYSLAHGEDKFLWISDIRSAQAYTRQGRAPWQRG